MSLKNIPLITLLFGLFALSAHAAVIEVTTLANDGPGSLRSALQQAFSSSGEEYTIEIKVEGVMEVTEGFFISQRITINGPGADRLTIRAKDGSIAQQGRALFFAGPVGANSNGESSISGLTITNALGGGAFYVYHLPLSLNDCVITGNQCQGDSCGAGALFNGGAIINIKRCTISNNTAVGSLESDAHGGAIYSGGAKLTIENSTITGNTAKGADSSSNSSGGNAFGGAIATFGNITITSSTIAFNRVIAGNGRASRGVASGGGIYNNGLGYYPITLRNTIVAHNFVQSSTSRADDISGEITLNGFNLIGTRGADGVILGDSASDQIEVSDAKIAPLANNGGTTPTLALLPRSPAIDKGGLSFYEDRTSILTDQRGFPRPIDDPSIEPSPGGDNSDIGAFEVQFPNAVSRKMQGPNAFDINLPIPGATGIECRSGGPNGDHQMVVTFQNPVTVVGGVSVTSEDGLATADAPIINGQQVTVNLHHVTNAQWITVTLSNVNEGANSTNVVIPAGMLIGDINADAKVDLLDIAAAKAQSGQTIKSSNCREDVSVNGRINSSDISLVKSQQGASLPTQAATVRRKGEVNRRP